MKTETNSMRIVKPEKTDTAGTPQQEKTLKIEIQARYARYA